MLQVGRVIANALVVSCLVFPRPINCRKGFVFWILNLLNWHRPPSSIFYQAIWLESNPNGTNSKANLHPQETLNAEGRGRWLAPLSASFHVDPPQSHVITSANHNEPQSTAMNRVLTVSGRSSSSLQVRRMLRLKLPSNLICVWTSVSNQGHVEHRND